MSSPHEEKLDENSMALLMEELTRAVADQDLTQLKQLTQNLPENWRRTKNNFGYTILQEAIRRDNREIFDFVLDSHSAQDLETVNRNGNTALMFTLNNIHWNAHLAMEYYTCEIIRKGASVSTICDNLHRDSFLHLAVAQSSINITLLLLQKGIDVNVGDKWGKTALHRVLLKGMHLQDLDFVTILLCYGADPFLESVSGFNAFKLAVLNQHITPIQEMLFLYTFDEYTSFDMNVGLLVELARNQSPFFFQIFESQVQFQLGTMSDDEYFALFTDLFSIDVAYLTIIVEKCASVISELIRIVSRDELSNFVLGKWRGRVQKWWVFLVHSSQNLTRLGLLFDNPTISPDFCNFIKTLDCTMVLYYIIVANRNDVSATSAILLFLLSYGLPCTVTMYHMVYAEYGFCELFKILLHMDFNPKGLIVFHWQSIRAVFMYDIHFNLDKIFENPENFMGIRVDDLLDFFAHPKLSNFLLSHVDKWRLSRTSVERIENHPRIPSLVELSRNAFRKHFIAKLNITRAGDFYSRLHDLELSIVIKRIITFETKVY